MLTEKAVLSVTHCFAVIFYRLIITLIIILKLTITQAELLHKLVVLPGIPPFLCPSYYVFGSSLSPSIGARASALILCILFCMCC